MQNLPKDEDKNKSEISLPMITMIGESRSHLTLPTLKVNVNKTMDIDKITNQKENQKQKMLNGAATHLKQRARDNPYQNSTKLSNQIMPRSTSSSSTNSNHEQKEKVVPKLQPLNTKPHKFDSDQEVKITPKMRNLPKLNSVGSSKPKPVRADSP